MFLATIEKARFISANFILVTTMAPDITKKLFINLSIFFHNKETL